MNFISTRGGECVSGAQAIAQGIAKDGGLFVPRRAFGNVYFLSERRDLSVARAAESVCERKAGRRKDVWRIRRGKVGVPQREGGGMPYPKRGGRKVVRFGRREALAN